MYLLFLFFAGTSTLNIFIYREAAFAAVLINRIGDGLDSNNGLKRHFQTIFKHFFQYKR